MYIYVHIHIYICIHVYTYTCTARPNSWFMFTVWLPDFRRLFYSSFSSKLKDLFRTMKCCSTWFSAQDHAVLVLLLNFVVHFRLTKMVRWKCFSHLNTSCQKAHRRGRPLQYFNMIHRVVRYQYVHRLVRVSVSEQPTFKGIEKSSCAWYVMHHVHVLCIYICLYISVYLYTYTYMIMYMHMYIYMYIHTYMYIYTYIYIVSTCIDMCVWAWASNLPLRASKIRPMHDAAAHCHTPQYTATHCNKLTL